MHMSKVPSQEEWGEWEQHPATKALKAVLESRIAGLKEQWAEGAFTHATTEAAVLANNHAVAQCQVYRDVLEIDHLTILGELSDEQSSREPADDDSDE